MYCITLNKEGYWVVVPCDVKDCLHRDLPDCPERKGDCVQLQELEQVGERRFP